jgi:hypothetical protein
LAIFVRSAQHLLIVQCWRINVWSYEKMNMRNLLVVLCLMGLTTTVALASNENVLLGPANVSLNLSLAGAYVLEKGESMESTHDYDPENTDFQYSIYPATATYEGTTDQVQIEVHEMSASRSLDETISGKRQISPLEHCIEQSNMMPRRADYQSEPYVIDGHEGILATVETGEENPLYIAAYSPDESDGSGSVICIVGSDFSWDTTKSIFESVSTQLA